MEKWSRASTLSNTVYGRAIIKMDILPINIENIHEQQINKTGQVYREIFEFPYVQKLYISLLLSLFLRSTPTLIILTFKVLPLLFSLSKSFYLSPSLWLFLLSCEDWEERVWGMWEKNSGSWEGVMAGSCRDLGDKRTWPDQGKEERKKTDFCCSSKRNIKINEILNNKLSIHSLPLILIRVNIQWLQWVFWVKSKELCATTAYALGSGYFSHFQLINLTFIWGDTCEKQNPAYSHLISFPYSSLFSPSLNLHPSPPSSP